MSELKAAVELVSTDVSGLNSTQRSPVLPSKLFPKMPFCWSLVALKNHHSSRLQPQILLSFCPKTTSPPWSKPLLFKISSFLCSPQTSGMLVGHMFFFFRGSREDGDRLLPWITLLTHLAGLYTVNLKCLVQLIPSLDSYVMLNVVFPNFWMHWKYNLKMHRVPT